MKTTIGAYDIATKQVAVTFAHIGVMFTRGVNACLDDDGAYDKAATADRIAAVALGTARQIESGAIINPPSTPEAEASDDPS